VTPMRAEWKADAPPGEALAMKRQRLRGRPKVKQCLTWNRGACPGTHSRSQAAAGSIAIENKGYR
jgi:hypothetical protein